MSSGTLSYAVENRVAYLTLDDGGPNALNTDVFNAFFSTLEEAENDDNVGAVVIAGREGFFSAGMDLKWMKEISRDELGTIGPNMASLAKRIFVFPKPVIAAVDGHAIAGGAIILLACDRSVGSDSDYKVGLNEVALGIPFGGFALKLAQSHLVPSAFGAGLLHGETYGPARSLEIGYLDEVVPSAELYTRVREVAERAAGLNPFAYHATKLGMRTELANEMQEQIDSGVLVPLFQAFADLRQSENA